jgi:hypothetical protein
LCDSFSTFTVTFEDFLVIQDAKEIIHRYGDVWIGQFLAEPIGTIVNGRFRGEHRICKQSNISFAGDFIYMNQTQLTECALTAMLLRHFEIGVMSFRLLYLRNSCLGPIGVEISDWDRLTNKSLFLPQMRP